MRGATPRGVTTRAPWAGILQGVYAFTGIVRFWDVQRHVETEPDDILRASVLYERWRLAIELAAGPLLGKGSLTPDGVRFVTVLREQGRRRRVRPVPAEAAEIAREVALDNWLTWQLRHTALDAAGVAALAAAYRRGEPLGGQLLPDGLDRGRHQEDRLHPQKPPAEHALPGAAAVPAVVRRRTCLSSVRPMPSWSAGTRARRSRPTARSSPPSRTRPPGLAWRWRSIGSPRSIAAGIRHALAAAIRNARVPCRPGDPR